MNCLNNLIDTHAHLDDNQFDDVAQIVLNAKNAGVNRIITAGTDINSSKKSVELTKKFEEVFCVVGIHPMDIDTLPTDYIDKLKDLAKHEKVVGIGEIGLDYHWRQDNIEKQKEVFVSQIKLAHSLKLPVVIHSRDATRDMLTTLKENSKYLTYGGVLHCFSESVETYKQIEKLGLHIGVGGTSTYSNARKTVEVLKECRKDRVILETDCPYLSPVPNRGKRNEPAFVTFTAQKVADIWGCDVEEVAKTTTNNAKNLFWR